MYGKRPKDRAKAETEEDDSRFTIHKASEANDLLFSSYLPDSLAGLTLDALSLDHVDRRS